MQKTSIFAPVIMMLLPSDFIIQSCLIKSNHSAYYKQNHYEKI